MSNFSNSFWSPDYAAGLGVLFGKLHQGVKENEQVLTIARMRAEAEELYGEHLANIGPVTDAIKDGFQKDEGASVRKAYDGMRGEMEAAAVNHAKIANNIRALVVHPFGRWCEAHAARVQNSQDDLQMRTKAHDRQAEVVRKLRSHYYNKCRQVEDLEEEDKLAFQEPSKEQNEESKSRIPAVKFLESPESDGEEPVEIGDQTYPPEQIKTILKGMLETIPMREVKVPILGTYQNTSTGADITEYIQKHLGGNTISYAERVGQDLISNGYLRLIGNVGSIFANSSKLNYQWRPKTFQMTGVQPSRRPLERNNSTPVGDWTDVSNVGDYISGWNPLNNPHPNESQSERLAREAREADERYKAAVRKLDLLRQDLEENMFEHLKFMERCELDRLKAIKSVILDFSGAIGNVIPSLQSTVDKMMLFQETVRPHGDLRYLLENYRTGQFVPKVTPYENYYNSVDEQTFGIDLEARARADRKRVPIIVTTLLTFLDNRYPDLEGDEARRSIWLVDVPLAATHHLRNVINTGKAIPREVLEKYELPIVASGLKLFLLELPDSLVSSHVYEIIRTIYSTTAPATDEASRVSVLQSTLGQLRLANIATLDAIMTHFTRLIELTSADEAYTAALAHTLAPCVLRPRTENSLTVNERYSYRLIRDLFAHKDAIFGALKRASSSSTRARLSLRQSSAPPGAAATTTNNHHSDEANRRANVEARNRAIAAHHARAPSPAPPPSPRLSQHRRDRSADAAATRFPVHTPAERRAKTASLEVPSPHAPVLSRPSSAGDKAGGAPGADADASGPRADSPSASRADAASTPPLVADPPSRNRAVRNRGASGGLQRAGLGMAKRDSSGGAGLGLVKRDSAGSAGGGKRDSAGSAGGAALGMTKRDSAGSAGDGAAAAAVANGNANVNANDAAGDAAAADAAGADEPVPERRGVELTDAPMDD